jgi:hypothetical protein
MGKYSEFKRLASVGMNPGGLPSEYSEVETTVPWWDASGGPVIQTLPFPSGISRHGTTTWSQWGNWK